MSAPLSPPPPEPENPTSNASSDTTETPDAVTSAAPPAAAASAAPETQWSVQSVLATIPTYKPQPQPHPTSTTPSPSSPIPFLHLLERLKTTKREGWRRFDITSGESIADHMYRMAVMTMLAPHSLGLDVAHCTKMALVHDMAEALVGDITPVDGVSKEEKARREAEAMGFLCGGLLGGGGAGGAGGAQGQSMRDIFAEYEEGKTPESVFVHDVDKVELLLQMVEYEKRAEGKSELGDQDLGEFSRVVERVQLEEMKEWCREILKERVEFWKGLGKTPKHLDTTV